MLLKTYLASLLTRTNMSSGKKNPTYSGAGFFAYTNCIRSCQPGKYIYKKMFGDQLKLHGKVECRPKTQALIVIIITTNPVNLVPGLHLTNLVNHLSYKSLRLTRNKGVPIALLKIHAKIQIIRMIKSFVTRKERNTMADTPKDGETVTPGDSQTTVQTPAAPQANADDKAEVERLKKEADQARMRANQLEKELEKKTAAEEEAKRKQLEENEEWKSLAEQEKAKREALESEKEANAKAAELKEATQEIFSQFSAEVVELAEEAGLGLNDATDEDKANLKAKLDKFAAKITSTKPVKPNNPGEASTNSNAELLQRMRAGDRQAREEVIGNLEGVKAMRAMAGLTPTE